ncbi:hypothetical protein Cni_G13421 [Canna indica]|uniref:Large ribosomal subunit protein uL4c n=1 Tax=Canna indica TaxID=4628 RepID=A0AAQ3KB84_9LILI|nr:hypothetical protein Cni_G13421 [Canna indica]
MPITCAATPSLSSLSSSFLASRLSVTKSHPFANISLTKPPAAPLRLLVRCELAALPVLSFSGEKVGEVPLDLKSAPPDTSRAVVHRGIVTEQQNKRRGTASTLTRGEVRGGGKKPYPQKKTGRARRGSQRTPLRPGGGVIFGPKPRDWSVKINRKEKRLALSTALASAAAAADALVVDDFVEEFDSGPKTKEFVAAMRRWGLDPKRKAMFLLTEVSDNVLLSCRNIGTIKLLTPRTLNMFDILDSEKLVLTKSAVEYLNSMYGEDAEEEDDEEDEGEEEEVLAGDN